MSTLYPILAHLQHKVSILPRAGWLVQFSISDGLVSPKRETNTDPHDAFFLFDILSHTITRLYSVLMFQDSVFCLISEWQISGDKVLSSPMGLCHWSYPVRHWHPQVPLSCAIWGVLQQLLNMHGERSSGGVAAQPFQHQCHLCSVAPAQEIISIVYCIFPISVQNNWDIERPKVLLQVVSRDQMNLIQFNRHLKQRWKLLGKLKV